MTVVVQLKYLLDFFLLISAIVNGLSSSAKIAIGVVAGIVFLVLVIVAISIGVCNYTGVCGSSSKSVSSSGRSAQVTGTSYAPAPDKLQVV